ncbi:unnamed protein product [Clonostachys rhizophaga]|uniref:Uncharacterized protein n=1 Tax=Clonostachys rhizophaga TaxID=160324 RepID=A0A9N9VJH8_9HYPO|nr:unnamed protein product [Clonostachys rhizophaga]
MSGFEPDAHADSRFNLVSTVAKLVLGQAANGRHSSSGTFGRVVAEHNGHLDRPQGSTAILALSEELLALSDGPRAVST